MNISVRSVVMNLKCWCSKMMNPCVLNAVRRTREKRCLLLGSLLDINLHHRAAKGLPVQRAARRIVRAVHKNERCKHANVMRFDVFGFWGLGIQA